MKIRLLIVMGILFGCKTGNTETMKVASNGGDGEVTTAEEDAILKTYPLSDPKYQGESEGMKWQVRFNFPNCNNPPHPKGAYCTMDDYKQANQDAGVAKQIEQWVFAPETKSVLASYFSFSNKEVRAILCKAAKTKNLKAKIYLHKQTFESTSDENVIKLKTCHPNIQVIPKGTNFGDGYLLHSKIMVISSAENPLPLSELSSEEKSANQDTIMHITSSSANMSSFGAGGLHLDNWLMFSDKYSSHLSQSNLCFFWALDKMEKKSGVDERIDFANKYKTCVSKIAAPAREDLKFFPVPHGNVNLQAYRDGMVPMLNKAKKNIKVAIHRLTTSMVTYPLLTAKQRGVDVSVIFDDDTYAISKCGGNALDVGPDDVKSFRDLQARKATIKFVDTNEQVKHILHNKFIVVDDEILLQGAGNFTNTSLNVNGLGNVEHFYIIKIPELVAAYSKGFDYLNSIASSPEQHALFSTKDKRLDESTGRPQFDTSVCQ